MVGCDIIRRILRSADLFYSTQFLRYNNLAEYKTTTGGIASIVVILALFIAFWSMIISAINKTTLSSSFVVKKNRQPPLMQLSLLQNNFMIGATIQTATSVLDLNKGPQIFDVRLRQFTVIGKNVTRQSLQMEPCTKEHWTMDTSLQIKFDVFELGKYKCLKRDRKYSLQGTTGSNVYKHLQFMVIACRNSTQNNNKCAPQEQIDQFIALNTNFHFGYGFANTLINTNQVEYINFHIDLENYVIFSKTTGVESQLYFTDYTINTDESILPLESMLKEKGFVNEKDPTYRTYSITDNSQPLVKFIVGKSSNSIIYKRQFLKLSTVLANIGGLVGAVISLLFITNMYNERALQYNISKQVFDKLPKQNNQVITEADPPRKSQIQFNFKNFILLYLHRAIGGFFRNKQCFKNSQYLNNVLLQINQHLDIKNLLRRITKIQACLDQVLTQEEIYKLKLKNDIDIEKARYLRMLFEQNFPPPQDFQMRNNEGGQTNNRMIKEDDMIFKESEDFYRQQQGRIFRDPFRSSSNSDDKERKSSKKRKREKSNKYRVPGNDKINSDSKSGYQTNEIFSNTTNEKKISNKGVKPKQFSQVPKNQLMKESKEDHMEKAGQLQRDSNKISSIQTLLIEQIQGPKKMQNYEGLQIKLDAWDEKSESNQSGKDKKSILNQALRKDKPKGKNLL